MLQATPLLLGSFVTVAVRTRLPLMGTLAVGGLTVTEIDATDSVELGPQAASSSRATTDRVFISRLLTASAEERSGRGAACTAPPWSLRPHDPADIAI